MEDLLAKVTQHAMSYAIRSGIAITSTYALKQCGRLMKTVDGHDKEELISLQSRLDAKIRIISPAIDMIELIAARGNTSLESAVSLTKSLRWDIQTLGSRVEKAVAEEQLSRRGSSKARSREQNDMELRVIIAEMKRLLQRIEDAVPLINLAITTSGVSLSTTLPATVSTSRLLQASTFLSAGDGQYYSLKPRSQQIGPTFTLSLYMLFAGHANRPHEDGLRETTWKEVIHKARVSLMRVPLDNVYDFPMPFGPTREHADEANHRSVPSDNKLQEFAYQLLIVEDLDDGRVHTFDDDEPQPETYNGIEQAGVRLIIPIHEIAKIFYADTGKILNIGTEGETNNPILLIKRDITAKPPRRMMEEQSIHAGYESDDSHTVAHDEDDEQSELEEQFRRESMPNVSEEPPVTGQPVFPWRLPPTLDLEWMAFEVYHEDTSSDSELDETEDLEPELTTTPPGTKQDGSESPGVLSDFSKLNLRQTTPSMSPVPQNTQLVPSPQKATIPHPQYTQQPPTSLPPIKTSLSVLEMLIRLTALQQFQQCSHLAVPDEFLNFFLSDSSTVGAGTDGELRRRVRREARARVGFDPYDESPIKRRGEEYLEHHAYQDGYEPSSPAHDTGYDYEGYPSSAGRSRSNTPTRSPTLSSFPNSASSRSNFTADVRNGKPGLGNVSSPSPLLRRATTQPGHLKQPNFGRPPTAPHTSSSPRLGQAQAQATRSFSAAPDTPPSSTRKL